MNLTAVSVPDPVAPSQKDAIKAREDRDRFSQEAQAYANDVVPKARGTAARQLQDAQAYRTRVVAESEGETSRFGQLLDAYERAPNVTRERLYIETIETVLSRAHKVLLDTSPGNNVIYLPLDNLMEKSSSSSSESVPGIIATPGGRGQDSSTDSMPVDPRTRGDR